MIDQYKRTRTGLLFGLGAYGFWGLMPLYFWVLYEVPPTETVAHRMLWSLVFVAVLATFLKRWQAIRTAITTPRVALTLALTSILIAINWLVYTYAVVNEHLLEASLGYYLIPLVNVLIGVFLLKERLSLLQKSAVLLAAAGVAVLATGAGDALWVSLTIAASFAFYGVLRKVTPVDSLEGLLIESMLLAPFGAGWILWLLSTGQSSLGTSPVIDLFLVMGESSPPFLCFFSPRRPSACLIRPSASFNISPPRFNSCWRC